MTADIPSTPPSIARQVLHFLDPILSAAVRPGDSAEESLRKRLLMGGSIAILPVAAIWGALYAFYGEWIAAAITLTYAAINGLGIVAMAYTGNRQPFAIIQLACTLVLPFLLDIILGGWAASSAVILGALMAPLGALLYFNRDTAVIWFGLFLGIVTVSGIIDPFLSHDNNLPGVLRTALYALNIIIVSSLAFFETLSYVYQRDRAMGLLRVEQGRTYHLLTNILPQSIADILVDDDRTIAETFDSVSIMFADVVGYTPLTATSDPLDLVNTLNDIYSAFDDIVGEFGLEKIRTMGDGYMVAAGVPQPKPDHAACTARAALAMMDAVDRYNAEQASSIELRIGINSGSVIGGVIGRKKFSYDVWGDSVNVASRMESNGLPGEIQVAPDAYELLKDSFTFKKRGRIEIKGKGGIETWLLLGEK